MNQPMVYTLTDGREIRWLILGPDPANPNLIFVVNRSAELEGPERFCPPTRRPSYVVGHMHIDTLQRLSQMPGVFKT